MGRPHKFPIPQDARVGNPTTIVSKQKVLALYNQNNPSNTRQNYCEVVVNWFIDQALCVYGWSLAYPSGCGQGINLAYNGGAMPPIGNNSSKLLLD
ncbi:hypothetical protein RFM33_004332 [Vibrio vulnificus]|nr:hypothetical protein [Vibrio vulnificus]